MPFDNYEGLGCGDCIYFVPVQTDENGVQTTFHPECHRFPPARITDGAVLAEFAVVTSEMWCGELTQKNEGFPINIRRKRKRK